MVLTKGRHLGRRLGPGPVGAQAGGPSTSLPRMFLSLLPPFTLKSNGKNNLQRGLKKITVRRRRRGRTKQRPALQSPLRRERPWVGSRRERGRRARRRGARASPGAQATGEKQKRARTNVGTPWPRPRVPLSSAWLAAGPRFAPLTPLGKWLAHRPTRDPARPSVVVFEELSCSFFQNKRMMNRQRAKVFLP